MIHGTMAHTVIRFNKQLQRQGKRCENFATRPTSHFRLVFVTMSVQGTSTEILQKLADAAQIDYDHFIRTSEPDHRFVVQHFWVRAIAEDRRTS